MILRPRMTKLSSSVMLAKALSFASSRRDTRTSVIFIGLPFPRRHPGGSWFGPLPDVDCLTRCFRDGGEQPPHRESPGNFGGSRFRFENREYRRPTPRHGRKTRLLGEQFFHEPGDDRIRRQNSCLKRIPKRQCTPWKPCQDGISGPQVKTGPMGCQPKTPL